MVAHPFSLAISKAALRLILYPELNFTDRSDNSFFLTASAKYMTKNITA
jgi:hypothetical protein